MLNAGYLSSLKDRLQQPLPGRAAQLEMAAYAGRLSFDPPQNAMRAGVLLLLHKHESELGTVLIERVTHDQDKHSGQISLPGGKLDRCDIDIEACALREANEEIGIVKEQIEIIGRLSDLYIPVSGFLVTPVVGMTMDPVDLVPQPSEVADILRVPLSWLFASDVRHTRDLRLQNGMHLRDVPYFNLQGKVVWGATAMILNEFLKISEEILAD